MVSTFFSVMREKGEIAGSAAIRSAASINSRERE